MSWFGRRLGKMSPGHEMAQAARIASRVAHCVGFVGGGWRGFYGLTPLSLLTNHDDNSEARPPAVKRSSSFLVE